MHILIASNDDFQASLESAEQGSVISWLVPKSAEVGDMCALSHWSLGLFGFGYLLSNAEPDPHKSGKYRAQLTEIEILGEMLPHSVLAEQLPAWKWPTYPKSKTTVPDDIENQLLELIQDFVEPRAIEIEETVSEEGAARLRIHQTRERDSALAEGKRTSGLNSGRRLTCEVCRFDCEAVYGQLGSRFCEVHHLRPIGQRNGNEPTRLEELAVVCSNCHRMLHRYGLLSIEELKATVATSE